MAALKTAVEQQDHLVLLQKPPGEKGRFRISHLAYDIRKRRRVWMVVSKGSGLATEDLTDLSWGSNDNIMVTDIPQEKSR
jgi:hypothetical protein